MDRFEAFVARHWEWSQRIFGEGEQTEGLTSHIGKEIEEVRAKPHDLVEWIDVMVLAMDGYLRHGGSPQELLRDLEAKQAINLARTWQAPAAPGGPIEHDRSKD